jgi:hypothetical protein
VTTTAAAAGTRRHTGTYPAEPRQVGLARAALAGWLVGGPQADEAVLVASDFATNSVLFFFFLPLFPCRDNRHQRQGDLRPVLFDYLFLAALFTEPREKGQPPTGQGQL